MAIRPDILNADANMLVHELGDDAYAEARLMQNCAAHGSRCKFRGHRAARPREVRSAGRMKPAP
jgi:hypothetical protein